MKKFVVVLYCIFLGSSALASSYCPTPEEYRAYLRNYANKAKNLFINNLFKMNILISVTKVNSKCPFFGDSN